MMPFSSTVFSVLIASPSDVPNERSAIAESLHEWNSLNASDTSIVLLPVMWESHSAPYMGDRPQAIINEQVVRNCDMIIGAFWTRLGSPTGIEDSGTVEEIKWFLKQKKPVMLYFSKAAVNVDEIDTSQLEKLKDFKKSIRDQGIQTQYSSVGELKQLLSRHLTIIVKGMTVGPIVNAQVVRAAKASTKLEKLESEPEYSMQEDRIRLVDYTDKAFVVLGNSLPYKDALSSLGGRWISIRTGGKAWMYSKKHVEAVAKALRIGPVLEKL
jgi:hypothetical protein